VGPLLLQCNKTSPRLDKDGIHLFYERKGDGPERLAGRACFTQLWTLGADGVWRLARIFSFAHEKAE